MATVPAQAPIVVKLSPPYPGFPSTVDGSGAVSWVESHISQAVVTSSISPPMKGRRNLWGENVQVYTRESGRGSASACEGFALAGGRVANFVSGQDLLRMKEELYTIAGKRLPVVFHADARAIASQSLNFECGHDAVMGVADCGWGMLFARNAQEAADLALIARRAAEYSETPFFQVQDGLATTHTIESVLLPEPEMMAFYVEPPRERLRALFDPANPMLSGCVQNQDSYMKGRVAQRLFYDRVQPALKAATDEFAELTGRSYGPLRLYRMEDAEYAFAGMGSMMETAEAAVDYLRSQGIRIGAVGVTCFRPFPSEELAGALLGCRGVTVVERTDQPLAQSNPLALEVKAALSDARTERIVMPEIYSAAAGLGGREIRPGHFLGISENMLYDGFKNVAIGVKWPDGLEMSEDPDLRPAGAFSMRVHSAGFGSDIHKTIAGVAARLFGLEVQAFSKYGVERNGDPATYSLTLATERIRTHCELNTVDLVAIQNPKAIPAGAPLAGLRSGGTLYLQSELAPDKVWSSLPVEIQRTIHERRLRLFALNTSPIAREMQGMVLLGAFLRLTPFREQSELTEKELFQLLEHALGKHFGERGTAARLDAVRRGYFEVVEAQTGFLRSSTGNGSPAWRLPGSPAEGNLTPEDFRERVVGSYLHGCEDELEADEYAARGLMPASSARGRGFLHLAQELPVFMPHDCVGCMECVNECPDTAILARVVEARQLESSLRKIHPFDLRGELRLHFVATDKYHDGLFGLFVDPDKCKGCGECVTVCGSHACLKMAPKGELDIAGYDAGMDLWRDLRETPKRFIRDRSLGDMMLADRSLLYSGGAGSCPGCGEATALRMMLAATGFVYGPDKIGIVAASGCHTVFGSTYPFNPFGVPWTNSLSGNAPADAIGIRLRWDQEGHAKRRLWVVGGEEALSDIGFESLSRLLMSGMDIKVLVLGTKGNPGPRKELARIAMMHPNVYAAQTTPGHLNHFYKAVMEANAYSGPALVVAYTACLPEHGVSADRAAAQAKLAVESRVFPLLTYDPGRGGRIRERLSLRGNPAVTEDWFVNPQSGSVVDFVAFARTEERFARHFGADGSPDEYLQLAQSDRLESWRHLQELAGLR